MRKLIWTLGMGIIGFLLGYHGLSVRVYGHWLFTVRDLALATLWDASIGFGFGSIFGEGRPPRKRLIFWWGFTLTLLAAFFAPAFRFLLPDSHVDHVTPGLFALSSVVGALFGVLLGNWHYRTERAKIA